MKDSVKKSIFLLSLAAIIIISLVIKSITKEEDFHEKYDGVDLTVDVEGAQREGTYSAYVSSHKDAKYPTNDIQLSMTDYAEGKDVKVHEQYEGEKDVLYTGSNSEVTWNVEVPEAGFYNILLDYMTVESRGVAAERSVKINGEFPFTDSANLVFGRIWKDSSEPRVDNQGNEIRPTQIEEYRWQSKYCKDEMGYEAEPFMYYFEKGENTLTLSAVNEPLAIKSITLKAIKDKVEYKDYISAQTKPDATGEGLTYSQIIQGEDSTLRSESSLYAKYDRSSPTTQPYTVMNTVLNYIGGESWKDSGQWIEWDFEVPEDGYYSITIKGRQNYQRGSNSSRAILIDGEILFEELKEVHFEYSNDWDVKKLGDENGEPYWIYLTKGKHTLRTEAVLGGMGPILQDLEDSIFRLNQIYRKLLVYTGPTPDQFRDYHVDKVYPEIIEAMDLESKRLYKIVDDTVAYTGQKSDQIASAQTVAQQLEKFVKKPDKITVEFTPFKDNITALGTSTLKMSETKLDIDYIAITGKDVPAIDDKANGFQKVTHEVKSFFSSYLVDYDAVGNVYDGDDEQVVKVWVLTGRDQGTILKNMVDEEFTLDTGIKVNVEIVAQASLLTAVVAGRGPNVVISVGADQPVNYALRNAVEDLSQFDDLPEVLKSYTPSSYEQYRLGDKIYAVPETQTFNVMFYRTDVLEEMGLEVPQTWKQLIEMLPTIQDHNMSIGIPSAAGSSSNATAVAGLGNSDLSMYFSMLFQNGGDLYNEEGTATTVDDEAGVAAMKEYTEYFTDYGIPTFFDFVSQFRSGEMPIGVASYSTYNTLMVSAPEIRGLWDFTLIPGTEKTDSNGKTYIDRTGMITGSATMMIKTEDEALRNASWEFMKWWAKADTQVRFGREMEALLGSSARYATANIDAFSQLAWNDDDIKILSEQWRQTKGIREVPGGYYTGRHLTNAMRKIVNEKVDPRETILDYTITIDEEITKKRIEFGLPVEKNQDKK